MPRKTSRLSSQLVVSGVFLLVSLIVSVYIVSQTSKPLQPKAEAELAYAPTSTSNLLEAIQTPSAIAVTPTLTNTPYPVGIKIGLFPLNPDAESIQPEVEQALLQVLA